MTDSRRSHETSSLRAFFDEHLTHLHQLASNFGDHIHVATSHSEEDKQIVESFVDASNNRMRIVQGYSEKLRGHVRALHNHVLHVTNQIPPPVDLNQETFRTTPLVNSLFVNSDDIDRLFKINPDAATYLRTHHPYQVPTVYALLTACKSEKSMLGVGMLGSLLVRDLPQQVVNFSSHKIHKPCASSAELNTALKKYLLDRIVTLVTQEMASRIAAQTLRPTDNSYEGRLKSLANPDIYLNTLLEHLEVPSKLLSIDKSHFRLSKLGIKIDSNDRQCANEFDIHELTWSDNSRDVVLQIAYTR